MEISKEIEKDYDSFLDTLFHLKVSAIVFEDYVKNLHKTIDTIYEKVDSLEQSIENNGEAYRALYYFFKRDMYTFDTALMQHDVNFIREEKLFGSWVTKFDKLIYKIYKEVEDKV